MFDLLTEPFMRIVLAGALITAVTCAYLGVFMILKRIVFMGIVLSQAAALGVAIGFFFGLHPLASSFFITLLAIVILWIPFAEKSISNEGLLGSAYALFAAFSVILIAKNPLAEAKGLNIVSGNLIYMNTNDLVVLSLAALFVGVLHIFFFKEFIFVSFDRETAHAAGIKAAFFDLLLYLSIGVAISLSMRICGVIFVFSSLVIPAVASILIMRTVKGIFFMSMVIASAGVVGGTGISYVLDLPTGPAVTGIYGLIFLVFAAAKFLLFRFNGKKPVLPLM